MVAAHVRLVGHDAVFHRIVRQRQRAIDVGLVSVLETHGMAGLVQIGGPGVVALDRAVVECAVLAGLAHPHVAAPGPGRGVVGPSRLCCVAVGVAQVGVHRRGLGDFREGDVGDGSERRQDAAAHGRLCRCAQRDECADLAIEIVVVEGGAGGEAEGEIVRSPLGADQQAIDVEVAGRSGRSRRGLGQHGSAVACSRRGVAGAAGAGAARAGISRHVDVEVARRQHVVSPFLPLGIVATGTLAPPWLGES